MKIFRRSACLVSMAAALLLALPVLTAAQDRAPIDVHSLGPLVGEPVPDFNLPDQHGQPQTLDSIKGTKWRDVAVSPFGDW